MFGKIIITLLLGYALWVFVTVACLGGIRGYWQGRKSRAKMLQQMKAGQTGDSQRSYNSFDKIFG